MSIHNIETCRCYSCEVRYIELEAAADAEPCDPLDDAIRRYIQLLQEEGIPLTASITVAAVLDDLCELGGIPKPLAVSTALRD